MNKLGETFAEVLDYPLGWHPSRIFYLDRDGMILTFKDRLIVTDDHRAISHLLDLLGKDDPRLLFNNWASVKHSFGVINPDKNLVCFIPSQNDHESITQTEVKTRVRTFFPCQQIENLFEMRAELEWAFPFNTVL